MAVSRAKGNPSIDQVGTGGPSRADRYGGAYTSPVSAKEMFSADEGSYYVGKTPTPGTGIVGHAAPTTFDETKPYLLLYNGGSNRVYPQYLRLHDSVASTGGARVQFTIVTDTGNRYSSAGTALSITNVNQDDVTSTACLGYVGAVVATAASGARRIQDHIVFRGTIDIVEDVYTIVFGTPDGAGQAASRTATVVDVARVAPPVVIGPGQSLLIHQWVGSQSAGPTFQVSFGYIER